MENALLEAAMTQGLWAALFVALFVWEIRQSSAREKKYQELLDKTVEKFDDLKQGIDRINDKMGVAVDEHR